jgi:3-dehydroquinate dehydratase
MSVQQPVRILILNANSSTHMSHGMEEAIKSMGLPDV